jgi:ABC-2 type transport system ATP-binding protein
MTLQDFVTYAAWTRGVRSEDWGSAVGHALGYVGLEESRRQKMGKLSGGMRQRAGIAWAVVGRPGLILLDEPTVGLDPQQRLLFRHLLAGLKASAVMLSTHMTEDVDAVCDRVLVMDEGALRFQGSVEELKRNVTPDIAGHTLVERAYMSVLGSDPVTA